MQYLRILSSCFGEEDFQRFASNCLWLFFANNVGVPPFEQTLINTCPRIICVQYLRILFSSFGEEDFSKALH